MTTGTYAILSRRRVFRGDNAGARIGLLTEIARKAGVVLAEERRALLSTAPEPERLDELGTGILNAADRDEAQRQVDRFLASLSPPPGPEVG